MTTQETAHAIALVVGLPMLAVMMLERAQRHTERMRPARKKATKQHHHDTKTYKIARPKSARATTNNNRKDSK